MAVISLVLSCPNISALPAGPSAGRVNRLFVAAVIMKTAEDFTIHSHYQTLHQPVDALDPLDKTALEDFRI